MKELEPFVDKEKLNTLKQHKSKNSIIRNIQQETSISHKQLLYKNIK